MIASSSSGRQGEEEGEEEDEAEETVVSMLFHGPSIRHTARKIGEPRGRPCGTIAMPRSTTPPAFDTTPLVTLATPASSPSEVGPSGTRSPPDLLSSNGDNVLQHLTHLASPKS
jgi:hypothetical protein